MPWGTWTPTSLHRVARVVGSSMNAVEVVTDAGAGFLKAMGNAQGEHALACELIGSSLAEWLELPTLDFALLDVGGEGTTVFLDDDETVPLAERRRAAPGPAFVTRAIQAGSWSGDPKELRQLTNPEVIPGLVLLDTWIGNPDRHPRRPPDASISRWENQNLDNVLLELLPRNRLRLVAMDFSVCLHCRDGGLRNGYGYQLVRDDGVYGLFREFEPFVTEAALRPFLQRLHRADDLQQHVVEVVGRIPREWQVDAATQDAVRVFLCARASYLVENFLTNLRRAIPHLSI